MALWIFHPAQRWAGLICPRQAHTRKSFLCRLVYRQPLYKFLPWLILLLQIDQEVVLLFWDCLWIKADCVEISSAVLLAVPDSSDHWCPKREVRGTWVKWRASKQYVCEFMCVCRACMFKTEPVSLLHFDLEIIRGCKLYKCRFVLYTGSHAHRHPINTHVGVHTPTVGSCVWVKEASSVIKPTSGPSISGRCEVHCPEWAQRAL